MEKQYSVHLSVSELENGQFLATSDDLPGLVAQGRTVNEALEIARDVARKLLESYAEHGDPIPDSLKRISGTFEVDLPVGL